VFADPAGSFTTAAAMVACVKKALRDKFKTELKESAWQYSAEPAWSLSPPPSSPPWMGLRRP
jgi:methylene-tetrahydromethanopterin dehydrogenase